MRWKHKLEKPDQRSRNQTFLSRELAAIDLDSPIEINADTSIWSDYDKLKAFYKEMGFHKFLENLEGTTESVVSYWV